jgi:transcriptional regulator with XRE-family HTH domain
MEFATLLKTLREKMNLSQAGLAERSGISKRTIEGWESGRRAPRLGVLPRLAAALGVAPDVLLRAVLDEKFEAVKLRFKSPAAAPPKAKKPKGGKK